MPSSKKKYSSIYYQRNKKPLPGKGLDQDQPLLPVQKVEDNPNDQLIRNIISSLIDIKYKDNRDILNKLSNTSIDDLRNINFYLQYLI